MKLTKVSVKRDTDDEIEPLYWEKDEISIRDLSSASETGYQLDASPVEDVSGSDSDPIVDQEDLEKIRELLSHRTSEMGLECSRERRLARKERRRKQARSKGIKKQPPVYRDQTKYLYNIGAIDYIKEYKEWKKSLGLIQKQKENKKRSKPKRASNIAKYIDEKQGKKK